MRFSISLGVAIVAAVAAPCAAQTFRRLGGCPTLGCIFPPDQSDFIAGQYFDIRLEVHAPVNGSEASSSYKTPDTNFKFTIAKKDGGEAVKAAKYFGVDEPKLEKWEFEWYEDLFAEAADKASVVKVASKAYRKVQLQEAGEYVATLTYNGGSETVASWVVRDLDEVRKAKNVLLFIGDGMTTNMITAARLIGHKTVNGRYQSKMALDKFPVLGHQMTHSLDSFITDSANSASALYGGHKTSVNCLGVYADSSPDPFDDPKFENIAEMFQRVHGGHVGIVSKAAVADATPAALTAHTRDRDLYPQIVDSLLNGITNYSWTAWEGPDVLLGGGAESFFNKSLGGVTYENKDYYREFEKQGYKVVLDADELKATSSDEKTLGIFTISHMNTWLDVNVYPENLKGLENAPDGSGDDATNQPGLKEMTLKAIDILESRSGDKGWFLMSEAASIDKQMHILDYDRALGELLELDDTVKATIAKLSDDGILKETLVLVTADHGHGFDVMGSVDTNYLQAQKGNRQKRNAVGTYERSGLSQYVETGNLTYGEGAHFPSNWDPRYTLFQGTAAAPDRRENYEVHKDGPRLPAVNKTEAEDDYVVNPDDGKGGFRVSGNLALYEEQGVHSLTDVPVFAMGPCQELFGGVYNNIDIFFNMAECLGLGKVYGAK
jgi:alkaline phosphatase